MRSLINIFLLITILTNTLPIKHKTLLQYLPRLVTAPFLAAPLTVLLHTPHLSALVIAMGEVTAELRINAGTALARVELLMKK